MSSALHPGTVLSRALWVVSALAVPAKVASACVLEPMRLHRSDARLAQIDTAAPEAPVIFEARAYRRSGLTCGQDICVANNCGDMGGVAIDLDAGDDQTPTKRMGYRIELVDGVLPPALRSVIGVELAGPSPLRLPLAFDDVPSVDATLRVVAIDAAGNQSAPSQPFALGFDGCTLAATGEQCEHSYDADAEFRASGGTLVVSPEPAAEASENADPGLAFESAASLEAAHGCSLPGGTPRRSALSLLLPAVLSAAALGRLVARRRR
jgi:hypothetical protein